MSGEDEQLLDENINTEFKNENLHRINLKKSSRPIINIFINWILNIRITYS